ncbi:MAG: hypothetical protein M3R35_02660 [Candidatus Eremiobacteraeota bacterium]|nr:hypothetical protein [Candidatus Eremiobacteraeota bacterium]
MAKRLEDLDPGTPVRCGGEAAGEVRAVYSTGESKVPEYLCVYWTGRAEETLVSTDEVASIEDGVVLMQSSLSAYADLVAYDPARNPTLRRLR